MHLIRISGSTEPMRLLGEVEGLDFERASATRLEGDRWRVSGYATDAALQELGERGLSVEPVAAQEELSEQQDVLFSKLDADTAAALRAAEPGDEDEDAS